MSVFARILSEGFRIFFLATLISAVVLLGIWLWIYSADQFGLGLPEFPFAPAAMHWHAHEMIFGFATAAVGGFFLTAVPNWTGADGARARFLGAAAALWLAARFAVWFSGQLPPLVVALVCLAFLPVLGARLAMLLLKRPKPQNVILLAVLALIWTGELLVQADWMGWAWGDAGRGLRVALLALVALIAVIGGRVTPAFTRNAMIRTGREHDLPASGGQLDLAGSAAAIATAALAALPIPEVIPGAAACIAGALALIRLSRWQGLWTRPFAILWTMHLSYGLLGLGLIALGLAWIGVGSEIAAIHLLGIGGTGGMILSVLSRASLGHTGRPLIAPRPVAMAYALIPLAAILRWLAPQTGTLEPLLTLAAGLSWLAGFGLALVAMAPILTAPRAPREPAPPAPPRRP
ncbi:NnrS family protein [Sinirhodobacter sp. WL0062]|uniref:NnrS family protein n=1 Tax=Rhodobacter flavimaris TaxID=2907145 RepID=A0ABS8YZ08_9RHOB|nr:NnrS family protein [Sinirhodobacter sp. WL0062]MCE5973803.1 NnrS family protein [Sinirhodobacter sp. WL0062]